MIVTANNYCLKNLSRGRRLYDGKANTIYEVHNNGNIATKLIELESTDRITARNGEKRDVVEGKGITNNTISTILFKLFEEKGIPTHYVCEGTNEYSKVVYKAKMIQLEVIGRFIAAGSYCKRYDIKPGKKFDQMTYELTYKNDKLGDPFVSESVAANALNLASASELQLIKIYTYKIGEVAREFFAEYGLTLVDFKVEFGYNDHGIIMLCDEFSPDTCRLWDAKGKSYDKDVFRLNQGNVQETYNKLLNKITSK